MPTDPPVQGDDKYEFHPLCLMWPALTDAEYADRRADYQAHPERADDSTTVLAVDDADGRVKILDGRHNYLICNELGLAVTFETRSFPGRTAMVAFVNARNAFRRHLTASQRSVCIADCATYSRGGDRRSEDFKASRDALVPTQSEAAAAGGIGRATLQRGAKVVQDAPELKEAVRDGKLDVHTAAKAAGLPEQDRAKIAAAPNPKAAAKAKLKKRETDKGAGPDLVAPADPKSGDAAPQGGPTAADPAPAREAAAPTFAVPAAHDINRTLRAADELEKALVACLGGPARPLLGPLLVGKAAVEDRGEWAFPWLDRLTSALYAARPTGTCPNCLGDGCKTCKGTGMDRRQKKVGPRTPDPDAIDWDAEDAVPPEL